MYEPLGSRAKLHSGSTRGVEVDLTMLGVRLGDSERMLGVFGGVMWQEDLL